MIVLLFISFLSVLFVLFLFHLEFIVCGSWIEYVGELRVTYAKRQLDAHFLWHYGILEPKLFGLSQLFFPF